MKVKTTPPASEIVAQLKRLAGPDSDLEGMRRFGINTDNALGVRIPTLRQLARQIGRDHALALDLWKTGIHEARILASMMDDPAAVTAAQLEEWVAGFDSWDVCDQVCGNLFDRTSFAYDKAHEWSRRDEEYVKRAAFTLMATLASHDKADEDTKFLAFLPIIRREAHDERNFVKKAVNWALRGIGKRNANLLAAAIETAEEIKRLDSKAARWIAADALRELKARRAITSDQAEFRQYS